MVSTGMEMSEPSHPLIHMLGVPWTNDLPGMIEERSQPYASAFTPNTHHVHAVVPEK